MNDKIRRLLDEWDAEVRENGIWTSGHSIAARMAAILRSVGPSLVEQERQEEQAKWAEAVRTFRSTNAYRLASPLRRLGAVTQARESNGPRVQPMRARLSSMRPRRLTRANGMEGIGDAATR